ncbi:tRNA (cmo5U34)-methyltransferase [Methylomarinovum tepidoasis]|uniref:Carboxy-S-adenosyl-L-methionine synthase n=1 Tax=Methylomarinovum tepidoasis TaxID=2840183 RepID=A0AAU9CW08_9GAMM|nr:carboxy-S-adenosyl-L-methionine synthase CmoA [Methylomarinovum sp. IN45]BCX88334.1 tRNA (cmo5U34)-methyltransferase [Methylomarinovum sp. IN45]
MSSRDFDLNQTRDRLFADPQTPVAAFRFDDRVARVFDDMIERSVPGYRTIVTAIGLLGERLARPHSRCYDLGCSLGAVSLALAQRIQLPGCEIIAVDNAWPMLAQMRRRLAALEPLPTPVRPVCADLADVRIDNASLVVLNFTLQFVPLPQRADLIARIHQGLVPGGVLILSEKIALEDPRQQALFTELHHAFKRAQGYSGLEIARKRAALENVLVPEPLAVHRHRIEQAGFTSVEVWFQYFNFLSLIAIKAPASTGQSHE